MDTSEYIHRRAESLDFHFLIQAAISLNSAPLGKFQLELLMTSQNCIQVVWLHVASSIFQQQAGCKPLPVLEENYKKKVWTSERGGGLLQRQTSSEKVKGKLCRTE